MIETIFLFPLKLIWGIVKVPYGAIAVIAASQLYLQNPEGFINTSSEAINNIDLTAIIDTVVTLSQLVG